MSTASARSPTPATASRRSAAPATSLSRATQSRSTAATASSRAAPACRFARTRSTATPAARSTSPAAPPPVISAPSFVCANTTNNLASVGPTTGATYTWTVTNGTLTSGQGTPSIAFTAGASGNTIVQVVAAFGSCVNPNSVSMPIHAVPDVTISAPSEVCSGSTGVVASVPANPSATFSWSVTGATLTSGQGTNSITFDVPSNSAGVSL